MNLRILLLIILISSFTRGLEASAMASLKGKITDKSNSNAIPFATVYFPDQKIGTTSDINGNYTIDHLPASKILVQVSCLGYRTIVETLDLSQTTTRNFIMEYTATEMNEVVVTGLSKAAEQKRTPTPITIVPSSVLLQESSTNIIDAIARQPGISQVTTGPGISKPVIRGLGYNRVVVVADGIRQEGQQWGDEHGIEIDESTVSRVEILKGPASLAYGSDALAGVVNLISAPSPTEGNIKGQVISNYQSNNGLMAYSADLAGNLKGFTWNFRYSNKMAHAYKNKYDGYVYNSGFREQAGYGMIGINRAWGYSHLIVTAYHLMPGIIEGERDSLTGEFVKPVVADNNLVSDVPATNSDFKSYMPGVPYQNVNHYKAIWMNDIMTGNGSLKTTLGFQQNRRKEYGDILNPDQYGLYFLLNTLNYDFRYNLPEFSNFTLSFGVNGMGQESYNKGSEFLVPSYNLFDFGIFSIIKKNLGRFDISGGLRFDNRSENGKGLYLDANGQKTNREAAGAATKFNPFTSDFSGLSGSIGATWQISKAFYSKLNFSKGFRAPNIAELGANGVHEGTQRYEIGDPNLKSESSLQTDYALGLESEHISAEMDLFANNIQNYIFARRLDAMDGGDSISDGMRTYKFVSGHALLSGGEIRIDVHPHPLDWIHFENSFSLVQAIQPGLPDSVKYLPLIPPPRYQSELKFEAKNIRNVLKNVYFSVGLSHYFRQDRFYSAFNTETATPAYTLLRLGAGTEFEHNHRTVCSLFFTVDNLADVAYQSHLSRLKYVGYNYKTGREGVFNMGRNISLKVIIPIDYKP